MASVVSSRYDSHTSAGLYALSVGTGFLQANDVQLYAMNLKMIALKATTGTNSYAITGITSTDTIAFATGIRPSTATYKSNTAFNPTVSAAGKTGSVAISGNVLSGGIVFVGWLDVDA